MPPGFTKEKSEADLGIKTDANTGVKKDDLGNIIAFRGGSGDWHEVDPKTGSPLPSVIDNQPVRACYDIGG